MNKEASAAGKIILLGEHAVVYGIPAIAVPLSALRARARARAADRPLTLILRDLEGQRLSFPPAERGGAHPLIQMTALVLGHFDAPPPGGEISIQSDIPIASGLGSGAAASAALGRVLAALLGRRLPRAVLNELVFEIEKIHHGTPSGIDNTVVVHEKPVYFVKGSAPQTLAIATPLHILIADSGQPALTREAVAALRQRRGRQPRQTQQVFESIRQIVEEARLCLQRGDGRRLGRLMSANHRQLQQLEVSSAGLDRLVEAALGAGAWGAKLSGGGRGGNMTALVEPGALPAVRAALEGAGAVRVIDSTIAASG